MFALAPEILAALVALSFLGGAIVTSIGPGGILVVAGLYLLTSLSSAEVAGTASATFAVGAILGGAAFTRSGGIDWRVAGVVAATALFTAANYSLLDAVVAPLVYLISRAYLGGVAVGWWLAHRIVAERLKFALRVALIGVAASLVL
ncbi:hypothetical protein BRC94_08335 [Halobacteriales archaeon QS_5_70_17]|nr:MAG: hypothetical protein BRC94_08335 [Halobacteriales archaeon QS_5_70_17]